MAAEGELGGRLVVVIPAYRAGATIADVIAATRRAVPAAAICVVDDGSDDGTVAVATSAGAVVVTLPRNRGKGAALAAGLSRALSGPADVIVTLDADGQHDPREIPRLAGPVLAGQADLVLGARERTGGMPAGRRFNNWLSAALVSRLAGQVVPDAQTGFRAFARRVAAQVRPDELRYDYELAFLLGALEAGFRVTSIPVATIYRGAKSHFRALEDTWRMARVFARYGGSILRGTR